MAQNEMKAKTAPPERVRSMEGLGVTVPRALQVFRFQTRMFGDSSQHAWPKFFAVMEGEHKVGPCFSGKGAMRPGLALLIPAELQQSGEHPPGLA